MREVCPGHASRSAGAPAVSSETGAIGHRRRRASRPKSLDSAGSIRPGHRGLHFSFGRNSESEGER
jgi:hypothetical protein